ENRFCTPPRMDGTCTKRMDTAPWERGRQAGSRRTTGMHIGLMMECDFREGRTQQEAFDEALATAEAAEALGFDGVWLAERHFATPGGAAPVSSIGSAPLLLATAIAPRTSRLRVWAAAPLLP